MPAAEVEGERLHRRLLGPPPGQCLLRAAARGPPQPDLFRDDARRLRQEPERLPGGEPEVSAAGRGWLAAAALGLALSGCASMTASPPSEPGAGPAAAPRDRLAARHRQQAEALERDGQLRRAAEEWK